MSSMTMVAPGHWRQAHLFGDYYIRVQFDQNRSALLAPGAIGALYAVRWLNPGDIEGEVLTCGPLLETAEGIQIIPGGEHPNDLPLNAMFQSYTRLCEQLTHLHDRPGNRAKGAIRIGGNVTISTNAVILSGVTIGDGAVIGAGAVVTKDVPPFAIVAGNPARVIRYRFTPEEIELLLESAWWNIVQSDLTVLAPLLLGKAPVDLHQLLKQGAHRRIEHRGDEIVFQIKANRSFDVIGINKGGRFVGLQSLPPVILDYLRQMALPADAPITAMENLFDLI